MSAYDTSDNGTITGINVTPMVDIMLVLLIIFMVTAHIVADSGLKINLPKAATTAVPATVSMTVSINAKGEIYFMEQMTDMDRLKLNLMREAKLNPSVRVVLAADGGLSYQQVVAVLDTIKQAGVTRVALAAKQ
jgi:biopolymer transport protein ExbD